MNTIYNFKAIILELKKSLNLSLPLIGSQLFYASSGIITMIMIAYLGQKELATNALVMTIFISLIAISFGILSTVGVLVSHSYGIDDKRGISIAINQGIILSLILTIPMLLILWFFPKILYLTKQDPEVIQLSIPYFHSLAWCILPVNLLMGLEHFLIGVSSTRLVLFLSIFRMPLEISLFYSMLFGKWGMPKLGVVGISYGLAISIALSIFIIFYYLIFSKKMRQYKIFSNFLKFNKKYFFELMRVGWPLGGIRFFEMSFFAIIALMIGQFGRVVLASHQIAYQYLSFIVNIIYAISQATTVRIGNELGNNEKDNLELSLKVNIGIGFVFMLLVSMVYLYFPTSLIALVIDIHSPQNAELIKYTTSFLLLAVLLQLTECFHLMIAGALRALKDTKAIMYVTFMVFCLTLFVGYLLTSLVDFGAMGVWLGLIISLFIGTVILWIRFKYIINHVDLKSLITK